MTRIESRSNPLVVLVLLAVGGHAGPLRAQSPALPREIPAGHASALIGATVLPMTAGQEALEDYTVVVEQGRITAVGPRTTTAPPRGADLIDARGMFLLPGLIDSHVHFTDRSDLVLYLAEGVTTVRSMWSFPTALRWRDSIAAGTLLGPRIITASPGLDGPPGYWPRTVVVTDPDSAAARVAELKAAGYDLIKVYGSLSLEVYDAALRAARQLGVKVVGHVPTRVGVPHALASGLHTQEHLTGYPPLVRSLSTPPFTNPLANFGRWDVELDSARLEDWARRTARSGIWTTPTLTVSARHAEQTAALRARPEMTTLSVDSRAWFDNPLTQPFPYPNPEAGRVNRDRLVLALYRAGARLLVGTDAGVQYVLPGYSIHEELTAMVRAGLPPIAVLHAATVAPAEAHGLARDLGQVRRGFRADLLLLTADPRVDIVNVGRRAGVMAGGHWLSEPALKDLLSAAAP